MLYGVKSMISLIVQLSLVAFIFVYAIGLITGGPEKANKAAKWMLTKLVAVSIWLLKLTGKSVGAAFMGLGKFLKNMSS